MSTIPAPVRVGGVVLTATLLLSGCAGLRPGTAVEVGDEQVTTSELDDMTTSFCAAVEPQLDQQAQTAPNGFIRGLVAGSLAQRSAASQVAAEYGVDPESSEQYRQALNQLRTQISTLPEEQQEAVIAFQMAEPYVQATWVAVGEEITGGDGEPSDFEAAGAEEVQRWIQENGMEFDPSLGLTVRDGQVTRADDALSFALSEGAKAGQEEQPNAAAAAELPDPQRCGR